MADEVHLPKIDPDVCPPMLRAMADEAYLLKIGPDVWRLDPGSALRYARDDGSLLFLSTVIPGEDPGSIAASDGG